MPARRWRFLTALAIGATITSTACADDGPPLAQPATTTGDTTVLPATTAAAPAATAPAVTSSPAASSPAASTPPSTSMSTPTSSAATAAPTDPRPPLTNADGASEAFSGVGQLVGLGSPCTAWLLDAGEPGDPAYALTSGRCVGITDSTTIVRDQGVEGGIVRFRLFTDTPSDLAEIPVETVRYATMRGTDLAVLELGVTRREIIGLASYPLAAPPIDGDGIRVVGVPVTGVAADEQVLRGATCTAGPVVRLVELEWLWDAAVSSDCLGIVGGSWGSPVFDAASPTRVVGIITTTTIGPAPPAAATCYLGQPCELPATGATTVSDRTYAVPVDAWEACFTPAWDPSADGCPAEAAPVVVDASLRAVPPGATWAATISGGSGGALVVKSGPGATTDCRDAAGYAPALPAVPGSYDLPLPAAEGVYALCAAEIAPSGAPVTRDAGSAVVVVDATAPGATIEVSQTATGDGIRVEPIFVPPELASFDLKVGPGIDCADPAGYSVYEGVPVVVPAADLPATLCVIGEDEAGNQGAPQSFELS